jgi:hypothetical protein
MQTYQVGLVGLALFAFLATFAFLAWKSRLRDQERLLDRPVVIPGRTSGHSAFYIATTFANRPLDRVIAFGLAHRGRCTLSSSPKGIDVSRVGEVSFQIPRSGFLGVGASSAVIDRAVETNGLITLRWRLGREEVESHFRFVSSKVQQDALSDLKLVIGA